MDTILNFKSNLIQNFYILGLSPSKIFHITEDDKGVFLNIRQEALKDALIPEVISKFPPENSNYNSAKDEIVLAHCFPLGLRLLETIKDEKSCSYFEFHLDNILFNYNDEDKKIYSKIYFTCLTFYESLELYNNYKNEIICAINKDPKNSIEIVKDNIKDNTQPEPNTNIKKNYFLPKTICFASLMPFAKELRSILKVIYQLYCVKTKDSSIIPIEKFLEQIILQIPLPIWIQDQVEVQIKLGIELKEKMDKKTMKQKSKSSGNLLMSRLNFNKNKNVDDKVIKIKFPLYNINESYLRYDNTISFEECFSFFQIDDMIKIYKYILLEIPILFFCNHKEYLSNFIENLLGFLSPFKYVLPNIAILSKKYYGLINSEPKFIFGIYDKYTPDFFRNNNIDIGKNIIVVNINNDIRSESKIEEILKANNTEEKDYLDVDSEKEYDIITNKNGSKNNDNNNNIITNDYVIYDKNKIELINIELPSINKKKLSTALSSILSDAKKKAKKGEVDEYFNCKVHQAFYKFYVGLLNGITDYFLKSKFFYDAMRNGNCGNNMRYKSKTANLSDIYFLKELFNVDEFVKSCSKDVQPFYYVFFHTSIFLYYLRDRIYFNDKFNSLPYYQFDEILYLKRHKDIRKKHNELYDKFKKGKIESSKANKVYEIIIKTGYNFNEQEIQYIKNNKNKLLFKYGQFPQFDKDNLKKINYVLFPKLIFDNSYFDMKYENLYIMHGIMLPSEKLKDGFKKQITHKENSLKQLKYMLYPYLVENNKLTSKADFNILAYEYINFVWFILLCCSLWYCEPKEREMRLDKIFEILDKINYIEEKILNFIYINFLKYGNKTQCIKMLEKMKKFIGHSNYLFIVLLCNKLEEEKIEKKKPSIDISENNNNMIIRNNNKEGSCILKARSIIFSNDNFFQRRTSLPVEINFSSVNPQTPKLSMFLPQNKKGNKSFHISGANKLKEITHKENIIFNQGQLCPKCKEITLFELIGIIQLPIDKMKVNLDFACSKCGNKFNNIHIKYQLLLVDTRTNQSFLTKLGEFPLFSPYRIYTDLNYVQLNMKDYSLNINNIYTEKKNELFNYIFYFNWKNLPFDFLIPYKSMNNVNLDLIENNFGSIYIRDINKKRYTIKNQINMDNIIKKMENEFVTINISDSNFTDLTPCYTTSAIEGIYGSGNENEEKNENKNKGNSFCFLSK